MVVVHSAEAGLAVDGGGERIRHSGRRPRTHGGVVGQEVDGALPMVRINKYFILYLLWQLKKKI